MYFQAIRYIDFLNFQQIYFSQNLCFQGLLSMYFQFVDSFYIWEKKPRTISKTFNWKRKY
jgi:hypothetical protein